MKKDYTNKAVPSTVEKAIDKAVAESDSLDALCDKVNEIKEANAYTKARAVLLKELGAKDLKEAFKLMPKRCG